MSERFRSLKVILGAVALYEVSNLAFSKKTRQQILDRDGGKSVWSGSTEDLQACHINHDRTRSDYDSPSQGRTLTQEENYIDHFNRHGSISLGLPNPQNKSALGVLYHALKGRRDHLPPPSEAGTTYIKIPRK